MEYIDKEACRRCLAKNRMPDYIGTDEFEIIEAEYDKAVLISKNRVSDIIALNINVQCEKIVPARYICHPQIQCNFKLEHILANDKSNKNRLKTVKFKFIKK